MSNRTFLQIFCNYFFCFSGWLFGLVFQLTYAFVAEMVRTASPGGRATLPWVAGLWLTVGANVHGFWYGFIRPWLVDANLVAPPLQSFLMEAVPERERVIANGVYNVSWQIAWALGALVGGLIVNALGYQAPMLVAVPWYGGAALLFAWFFWRGRQRAGEIEKPQAETDAPLPASEFFRRD